MNRPRLAHLVAAAGMISATLGACSSSESGLADPVRYFCSSLQSSLQFAAEEYASNRDFLSAFGEVTDSGRGAMSLSLSSRFALCISVRDDDAQRLKAIERRFPLVLQTFRESMDRATVGQALIQLSDDLSEVNKLPLKK